MNTRTKKFASFSALLLGLTLLSGYGCFSLFQEIREKRESIDMMFARESVNAEKVQQQDEFARQYAFVQEGERILGGAFIRKEDVVSAIQELESLAQVSGVTIELNIQEGIVRPVAKTPAQAGVKDTRTEQEKKDQAEKDKKKAEEDKKKMVFLLEIRGTYEKTLDYVGRLERLQLIASFDSISMQKEDTEKKSESSSVSGVGETATVEDIQKENLVVTKVSLIYTQQ